MPAPASSGSATAADDGDDPADWPDADPHHERDTTGDDDVNVDDPFGGVSWADALAGADDFIRFTDTLRYINDIGRKLPEVSQVRDKLPEFLDACDDGPPHPARSTAAAANPTAAPDIACVGPMTMA
ncbi:hypothetical protein M2280_005397 [Prescottella agglutinans]|uniref:Uncharacterized protein n=1 Tax=Prescottella agglutinans TaxID=1644129 RepID=A0ABT6MIK7_9NOCA|nr:hypothetical protein [Prescottella agglutinans]